MEKKSGNACVVFAHATGKKSTDVDCDGDCKNCEHMKSQLGGGLLGKILEAL